MSAIGMAGVAQGLVPLLSTAAGISSANSSVIPPTAHAHKRGGASPLSQQLQQTVLSALQGAQSSGTDPNEAIQTAILNLLKKGSPSSTNTPASQSSSGSDSDDSGSVQNFLQTLQSNGVSPSQFRQDFISALQQLQSTPAAASSSSKIPIGLLINTMA